MKKKFLGMLFIGALFGMPFLNNRAYAVPKISLKVMMEDFDDLNNSRGIVLNVDEDIKVGSIIATGSDYREYCVRKMNGQPLSLSMMVSSYGLKNGDILLVLNKSTEEENFEPLCRLAVLCFNNGNKGNYFNDLVNRVYDLRNNKCYKKDIAKRRSIYLNVQQVTNRNLAQPRIEELICPGNCILNDYMKAPAWCSMYLGRIVERVPDLNEYFGEYAVNDMLCDLFPDFVKVDEMHNKRYIDSEELDIIIDVINCKMHLEKCYTKDKWTIQEKWDYIASKWSSINTDIISDIDYRLNTRT